MTYLINVYVLQKIIKVFLTQTNNSYSRFLLIVATHLRIHNFDLLPDGRPSELNRIEGKISINRSRTCQLP